MKPPAIPGHDTSPNNSTHNTPLKPSALRSVPSVVEMRGGGSIQAGQHPVTESTHTVTAGGSHHGLVSTPLLLNGQDNESVHTVTEPAYTVRANGGAGRRISPAFFAKLNGGPSDTAWHATTDPFNTVTSRDTHGVLNAALD